jgi:hypothetical protein
MKKIIKGLLYFFGGIIALVVIAAIVIPVFFKDDIKAAVDKQLEESIDANIVYDLDKFGLTIFKDFPNLSVEIQDFGVINNAPFEGDTLAMIGEFGVTLDIMSVFNGEQMQISRVYLDKPTIKILVNEEGKANYDIAKGDDEEVEDVEEDISEPFAIKLDFWEITNGRIVYDDKTIPTTIVLNGFNHSGSGEIADVYDLYLNTSVDDLNVAFDGSTYYEHSKFDSDITLNLDLAKGKYTFKENVLKLNEFPFGFDGFVSMPSEDIDMDIKFETKATAFKNILSVVPGMFMEGFDDIKTEGSLGFNGFVKGTFNETTMPGFFLNLLVKDAMFQYPDLPAAVKNIQVDLDIDNIDANMDNIAIALKKFHLDLGSNPIDMNVAMNVLKSEDFDIKDANVSAKINLGEITSFFPVDGMKVKGLFGMDVHAEGIYSDKQNLTPAVFGKMKLTDGWVNSEEYNVTAEDLTFDSWVKYNQNLSETDTILKVKHFGLTLDGERFESQLAVWDIEDISWDFMIKGLIDLEKMMKLSPMEGTILKGHIAVDELRSIGKMSDVDSGNYDALETYGKITITGFEYVEEELLPQGLKIINSVLTVNPKAIQLVSFDGFIGKSDMKMDGEITNYMGYTTDLMNDKITSNGILGGRLTYHSDVFYTGEWLEDSTDLPEMETAEEAPAGNYEDNAVPKNISFVMDATIDKIIYDNMNITEVAGELLIKDGIVDMSGLKMTILGGHFVMDGEYNTFNPLAPKFDFNMKIDRLSFKDSYETFNTVKKLAPVAENIEGAFSTDFKMSGPLDAELMPVYEKLSGIGDFFVENANVKDLALLEKITSATKMYKTDKLSIENTEIKAIIKDGKVIFEPFTTTSGESDFTIGGSRSLDSILDLDVKIDMPAGKAGDAMKGALAQYGLDGAIGDRITIPLKVTGKESSPKIDVLGAKSSGGNTSATAVVTETAKVEIDKAKEDAKKEIDKQKEEEKKKILADAKKEADKLRAEGKYQAKQVKEEAYYQAKDLEKKASKPWEKPAAKIAADKIRKEGDSKEKQIIKEANQKADKMMSEAQKKADSI